jgi:Ca-activated chloride channel family protein
MIGLTKNDAGLYPRKGNGPIPLVGVHATGDVTGIGTRIRLSQRFRNAEAIPIEAVYKFPLPESATVCGFRVRRADGTVIESSIDEREKAFELYDQALADGDGAWLLDQERPNIFTLSVGNLNPGDEIAVEVDYVSLLVTHGNEVRFFLPTSISPRYVPGDLPDNDGIPETDRINPEFAASVPYGLSIEVRVQGKDGVEYLESPSHTVRQMNLGNTVSVEFTSDTVPMDHDFVLNIKYREDIPCRAYAVKDTRGTFCQVDFTPGEMDGSGSSQEIVFLLDCSGSMQGSSIVEAKRALEIALRAMEYESYFNVYLFGSTYTKLFPKSKAYSAEALATALTWLEEVEADLGGTEILPALKDINRTALEKDIQRNILLLTDGEVGNEEEILSLVAGKMTQTRVFTIGVGHGPNEYFIRQTARSSGGAAEMIDPGERIEPKTLRLFRKTTSQCISSLRVCSNSVGIQSPAVLTAFSGETSSMFLKMDSLDVPQNLTVKGRIGEREQEWPVPIVILDDASSAIPVLWAREAIRDLEEDSEGVSARGSRQTRRKEGVTPKKVIGLSSEFGILSMLTSFVAVEIRPEERKCQDAAELRKVPVMITKDWHAVDSQFCFSTSQSMDLGEHIDISFDLCSDEDILFSAPSAIPNVDDSQGNLLFKILSLQRAPGGFMLDEDTASRLGISIDALEKQAKTTGGGLTYDTLILLETIIILEVLKTFYTDQEDIWRSVVGKSERWLASELQDKNVLVVGQSLHSFVKELVNGLTFQP